MAEFVEVMRQKDRMCESFDVYDLDCDDCPIVANNNLFGLPCDVFIRKNPAEAEKIIMDWAAEHPEPMYPTWKEWNDEAFPHTTKYICPQMFIEGLGCPLEFCRTCKIREQPIPADIAEKLGVKPKEVSK